MRDYCCTLAITPLLRELFRHLARGESAYQGGSKTERVGAVLLDQLAEASGRNLVEISHHHIGKALRRLVGTMQRNVKPAQKTDVILLGRGHLLISPEVTAYALRHFGFHSKPD